MNIVYFVNNPLLKRDIDLYGVDYFKEKDITVIFFVLHDIVSPDVFHKNDSDYEFQESFKTWSRLYGRLSKLNRKDYVFISDVPLSFQTLMLYVILTILNINYFFVDNWYVPASSDTSKRDKSQPVTIANIFFKIIKVTKIYGALYCFRFCIRKPEKIFCSVKDSVHAKQMRGRHSSIIPYCSFNYNLYLDARASHDQKGMPVKPYFVFIDQYLDKHPDFYKNKKKPPVTEKYYKALNSFCKGLSEYAGVKYVVASHPRRPITENVDFDTPYLYDYKSVFLVKECDFIVAHYSMAVDFAVLFGKPVLLITTDEIEKSWVNKFVVSLSKKLATDIINIDKPIDFSEIQSVFQNDASERERVYDKFKAEHILFDPKNDMRTYEIVYKELPL